LQKNKNFSVPALKDWVLVAKTAVPFGLKGQVKAYAVGEETDFSQVSFLIFQKSPPLKKGEERSEGNFPIFTFPLLKARLAESHLIFTLEGIKKVEEVEPLKGCSVYIDAKEMKPLADGVYYFRDLVGKKVFLPNGFEVGILEDYYQNLQQGLFILSAKDKTEILVPNIPGTVVSVGEDLVFDFEEDLLTLNAKKKS